MGQRKPGGVREIAETDPEPACHERGPHRLPPGLPEIVSGNCGPLPARLSGQRGDKAARSLVLAASQLTLLTGCFDLGLSGPNPVPRACFASAHPPLTSAEGVP